MNINELMKRIKMRLGIFYFKLPISDDDLMDVITYDTLTTFSTYFPNILVLPVNLSDTNRVPNIPNAYYIDTSMLDEGMTILGIEDVNYSNYNSYYDDALFYNGASDYTLLQAGVNLSGVMNVPIIPSFREPNILMFDEDIRPFFNSYNVTVSVTHNRSLATISPSYQDEFFKLALIDIKLFLYNNLKHFDNIDTTFGNISLKIDEWSNAEDDRKTLVNEWESKFIYAKPRKIYNV